MITARMPRHSQEQQPPHDECFLSRRRDDLSVSVPEGDGEALLKSINSCGLGPLSLQTVLVGYPSM
jgi:hypothetical protein